VGLLAWPFSSDGARDRLHFAAKVREKPKTWNGRVLLARGAEIFPSAG